MIGKTIVEELRDVEDYRILVFSDGTGYHLEYGVDLSAEKVQAVRAALLESAELGWLRALEREWYRDVATCDQRRAWTIATGGAVGPSKIRRGDDAELLRLGYYATLPTYCAICGETFCPNGTEGIAGPNCNADTALRAMFRREAFAELDESPLLAMFEGATDGAEPTQESEE